MQTGTEYTIVFNSKLGNLCRLAINIKMLILVVQLNKNRRATSNIKTFCHIVCINYVIK